MPEEVWSSRKRGRETICFITTLRSVFSISSCPYSAATVMAFFPSFPVRPTSAPASTRILTSSVRPCLTARRRAVEPSFRAASMSALAAETRNFTVSLLLLQTANINSVPPASSRRCTSAPPSTRILATSFRPSTIARESAVLPSFPRAFTSAPAESRAFTPSTQLFDTATIRAVQPCSLRVLTSAPFERRRPTRSALLHWTGRRKNEDHFTGDAPAARRASTSRMSTK
mmetsp:Transcript_10451/g.20281  ORF Transcript_10451/g.20281 Transcript_10451/m.20281 type:complete len:229 (+) Transcript_10451:498-1184(+)